MKRWHNGIKDVLPCFYGERWMETTTSNAQFSEPSVAKSKCGGRHSSKVKVLPWLHKWIRLLVLMAKHKQVVNAGLHISLSPIEVTSYCSYLLMKPLLQDKINQRQQTWSQLRISLVGKHKFYSLTSTQFLWHHQFRRILPKLLKKCDIIRLKYIFPYWLIIAWRILFWENSKPLVSQFLSGSKFLPQPKCFTWANLYICHLYSCVEFC